MTATTNAQTATATKAKRVIKKPAATQASAKPAKAAPTPKVKVEKPVRALYSFDTGYAGASTAINDRPSRTAIDHSRFGTQTGATMTERDQRSVEALRSQFGSKEFKRENLDAGIIKRLGERGCLVFVGGTHADSVYKLTPKGLGKPEPRAKKVANG